MGRVAAIDPGERRVGLAVSDELQLVARALPYIVASDEAGTARRISDVLGEFEIDVVLVGRPVHLDGSESQGTRKAEALCQELRKLGFCVKWVDERLSTVEATRQLRQLGIDSRAQREKVDSFSAAILLQAYLNFSRDRSRDCF